MAARLMLVACSIMYGSNYITIKFLQSTFTPSAVNTMRFALGSIVFLPAFFIKKYSSRVIFGGIELGFWCALGFIAQAMALERTAASKVAFFCGLSVIMPPLFELLEYLRRGKACRPNAGKVGKSLDARKFVSPCIALLGAAIFEWGGMESPKWSDLSLLITPLAFSMCFWRSEKLASHIGEEGTPSLIAGTMLMTVSVVSMLWAIANKEISWRDVVRPDFRKFWNRNVLLGIFYTGILT